MNFDFSEEQLMMKQLARDFAVKEIKPVVEQDETDHRFQKELVKKMGELGFYGCAIPEEYGGSNTGFVTHAIITEEIGRVSGSLRAPFNMQAMGTAREIFEYGNDDQKEKYVPQLVSAEALGCICITEPNAGSDVASMRTKAVEDGSHYIINGSKNWITYGEVADIGIVYAYTDQEKNGAVSEVGKNLGPPQHVECGEEYDCQQRGCRKRDGLEHPEGKTDDGDAEAPCPGRGKPFRRRAD